MRKHTLTKLFRQRFKLWRKNASELKLVKHLSIIKIQAIFRRYVAIKSKLEKIRKIRQTNKKYLIMCEYHHSFLLLQVLKNWNIIFEKTKYNRSINLIKLFIKTTHWKKQINNMKYKLMNLLKIKKKYTYKKLFYIWYNIFSKKLQKRAFVTIRFWMRRKLKKKKRTQHLQRLNTIEKDPYLEQIIFNLNKLFQKKYLIKWKCLYNVIKIEKSKNLVAKNLKYLYYKKNIKSKLNYFRAKEEYLTSKVIKKEYLYVSLSLYKWRFLTSVLRIQRVLRIFNAKNRKNKRIYQLQKLNYLNLRSKFNYKKLLFQKWQKIVKDKKSYFLYLIRKFIRKWRNKNILKRLNKIILRKYYLQILLEKLHFYTLKKSFQRLFQQLFLQKQIYGIKKIISLQIKMILKFYFNKFKKETKIQHILLDYFDYYRIKMNNKLSYKLLRLHHHHHHSHRDNNNTNNNTGFGFSNEDNNFSRQHQINNNNVNNNNNKIIKKLKVNNKILIDYNKFDQMKSLLIWKYFYNYTMKLKYELIKKESPKIVFYILEHLLNKNYYCLKIQKVIKRYLYMKEIKLKVIKNKIINEKYLIIQTKRFNQIQRKYFNKSKSYGIKLRYSRIKLQNFFRQIISKKIVNKLKIIKFNLTKNERIIYNKYKLKTLYKILKLIEFYYIIKNCEFFPLLKQNFQIQNYTNLNYSTNLKYKTLNSSTSLYSKECQKYLFQIRKNGIFIINFLNYNLNFNELNYLILNSKIIFIENIYETNFTSLLLQFLIQVFNGNKIIFCGGHINSEMMKQIVTFLVLREELLTLHFNEVNITYNILKPLLQTIQSNITMISELSIDVESVGIFGLCSIIVSLRVSIIFIIIYYYSPYLFIN